jgi:host factor-I protein
LTTLKTPQSIPRERTPKRIATRTVYWINLIMPDFDTSLPSIRQIQSLITDKKEVELKLVTDDLLVGKIFWQDMECICILDHYDQKTIVWRQAIVYMKPKP